MYGPLLSGWDGVAAQAQSNTRFDILRTLDVGDRFSIDLCGHCIEIDNYLVGTPTST